MVFMLSDRTHYEHFYDFVVSCLYVNSGTILRETEIGKNPVPRLTISNSTRWVRTTKNTPVNIQKTWNLNVLIHCLQYVQRFPANCTESDLENIFKGIPYYESFWRLSIRFTVWYKKVAWCHFVCYIAISYLSATLRAN